MATPHALKTPSQSGDACSAVMAGRGAVDNRPVRDRVSSDEWDARIQLAALYRILAHYRWTDSIYTHISLRVPGEDSFLINSFGMMYEEVTASSLVKVTVDGEIIDDPVGLGINRAGFVIHGSIHGARHEIACVMHTHTRAGVGVACQEAGLLPISQHAAVLSQQIAYHDFEGVAVDLNEQQRLAADMGDRFIMILRNHGLLAAGRSAAEALHYLVQVERACEIQIAALSGGVPLRMATPEAIAASVAVLESSGGDFSVEWAAMLRMVERVAPDYKL